MFGVPDASAACGESPSQRTLGTPIKLLWTCRAAWSILLPAPQDPGRLEPSWDAVAWGKQRGEDNPPVPLHHTSDSKLETLRQDPPA